MFKFIGRSHENDRLFDFYVEKVAIYAFLAPPRVTNGTRIVKTPHLGCM